MNRTALDGLMLVAAMREKLELPQPVGESVNLEPKWMPRAMQPSGFLLGMIPAAFCWPLTSERAVAPVGLGGGPCATGRGDARHRHGVAYALWQSNERPSELQLQERGQAELSVYADLHPRNTRERRRTVARRRQAKRRRYRFAARHRDRDPAQSGRDTAPSTVREV